MEGVDLEEDTWTAAESQWDDIDGRTEILENVSDRFYDNFQQVRAIFHYSHDHHEILICQIAIYRP